MKSLKQILIVLTAALLLVAAPGMITASFAGKGGKGKPDKGKPGKDKHSKVVVEEDEEDADEDGGEAKGKGKSKKSKGGKKEKSDSGGCETVTCPYCGKSFEPDTASNESDSGRDGMSYESESTGRSTKGNNGLGNGVDPQPPGNPKPNDMSGASPGNPGAKGR